MTIQKIINKLKKFNPESVFLYGSRARTDFLKRSDFEIGVIFKEENYVNRKKLKEIVKEKEVNIYPFKLEELKNCSFDTPFSKKIYLRELVEKAKTIEGKDIIGNLKKPNIEIIDLVRDIGFYLGRAFDSVLSSRLDNKINANMFFYKSNLFGTRCLIILELKKFPIEYPDIVKLSKNLEIEEEYKELIERAFKSRNIGTYKEQDLFKNITFLNQIVERKIMQRFGEEGNKILIK